MKLTYAMFKAAVDRMPGTPHDEIRDGLLAAFSAIDIDHATRDRCAEAVAGLYGRSDCHPETTMGDAWDQCCLAALAAIRALPAAPVRPLPTVEDVAKAICCPGRQCRFENKRDAWSACHSAMFARQAAQAAAVLALFTGDAK